MGGPGKCLVFYFYVYITFYMGINIKKKTDRNCEEAVIKSILEKYDCDKKQTKKIQ